MQIVWIEWKSWMVGLELEIIEQLYHRDSIWWHNIVSAGKCIQHTHVMSLHSNSWLNKIDASELKK